MMEKDADNIQVMVRVRPLNERERNEAAKPIVILNEDNPRMIVLDAKPEQKTFYFDYAVGGNVTQEDIFHIVGKPVTVACLEGYNSCIFAYGQTGAGKTYTMQGKGLELESATSVNRGLQPRVFDHLFSVTSKLQRDEEGAEFLIKCSYLEIYNEQIMDLLTHTNSNMQIREDLKKGVYVEGLTEEITANSDETIELLRKGASNRHIGATNMNFESSRSHSVFQMTIESKKITNGMTNVKVSKLNFVDLAGSERQKQTAAAGDRLKEAGNINKSLTVLGCVINSLVESSQGKARHIPYRDSKLTFLLKDCLGGNSRTCMIANVSSASTSFAETLSTLKFAQRAKMIKNKASINEESSGSLEALKKEIRKLKEELQEAKTKITTLETERPHNIGKRTPGGRSTPSFDLTEHPHIFSASQGSSAKQLGKKSTHISGKSTPYDREHQLQHKYWSDLNQKSLEMEVLFKQSIENLRDNEIKLKSESEKKEELLTVLLKGCELELEKEKALQAQKAKMPSNGIEVETGLNENAMEEEIDTRSKLLDNFIKNLPLITSLIKENFDLKDRDESGNMENEDFPSGTGNSVSFQISQTLIALRDLTEKLDSSIKEREILKEVMENLSANVNSNPGNFKNIMEEHLKQKTEYNTSLHKMASDISSLKEKLAEYQCSLEAEKNRSAEYLMDIEKMKDHRKNDTENYEKRIAELIEKFEENERQRSLSSTELEQKLSQRSIQIIELQNEVMMWKQKKEDCDLLIKEKVELVKQITKERDGFSEKREELLKEKASFENEFTLMTNQLKQLVEELNESKEEIMSLRSKADEDDMVKEELKKALIFAQEEFEKTINKNAADVLKLEKACEKMENVNERLESEKKRLLEELEVSQESYNFLSDELEEKKLLIEGQQEKITAFESTLQEKLTELQNQSDNIMCLEGEKNQLIAKTDEQIMDLNSKIEGLVTDKTKLLDQLKLENDERIRLEELLELNKNEREKLSIELSKELENIEKLNQEIKKHIEEFQELQKVNNLFEDENRKLCLEIEEKMDANMELVSENDELKDKISQISNILSEKTVELLNCEKKIDELELLISQTQEEKEKVQLDLEQCQQELASSLNDNANLRESIKHSEGEIAHLENILLAERQEKESALNLKENELSLRMKDIHRMDIEITSLKTKNRETNEDLDLTKSKLESTLAKVDVLNENLNKLNIEKAGLELHKEEMKEKIEALEVNRLQMSITNDRFEKKNAELSSDLLTLKSSFDLQKKMLEETDINLRTTANTLEMKITELETVSREKVELDAKCDGLENEIAIKDQNYSMLESKKRILVENYETKKVEMLEKIKILDQEKKEVTETLTLEINRISSILDVISNEKAELLTTSAREKAQLLQQVEESERALENAREEATKKAREYEEKLTNLKNDLQEQSEISVLEKKSLGNQISSLEKDIEDVENMRKEMCERIIFIEKEKNDLREKSVKAEEARTKEKNQLLTKIKGLEEQIVEKNKEKAQLEFNVLNLNEEKSLIQRDFERKRLEIQGMIAESLNMQLRAGSLKDSEFQDNVKQRIRDINVKFEKEKSKVAELQNELDGKDLELKEYLETLVKAQAQIDQYNEQVKEIENYKNLQIQNQELKVNFSNSQKKLKEYSEYCNKLKENYSQSKESITGQKAQIVTLELENKKLVEENKLAQYEKSKFEAELERMKNAEVERRKELKKYEEKIEQLMAQFALVKSKKDSAEKEKDKSAIDFKNKQMEGIKEENKKLRQEKSELLEKINKITKGKPVACLNPLENKKLQDYDSAKSKCDFWSTEVKKIIELAKNHVSDIPEKLTLSETISIDSLSDVTSCFKTLILRLSDEYKKIQDKEDEINYKFSQQKLFEHEQSLLKNKLIMLNKLNKDSIASSEIHDSNIKSYMLASHLKSSKKSPLSSDTMIFNDRTNSDDSLVVHNLTPSKKKKLF